MKLRYLIPSFIALVAMFVSCSENNDPTYLDEVKLSSSYVAIPQEGGQTAIKVTATGDWQLEKVFAVTTKNANNENVTTYYETPAWLKVDKVSGAAGETELTFSAEKTLDGRTCELLLTCGGKTQRINVIQGLSTISDATVAQVMAGPESKTYRVTGTVTSIANTVYGNWYMNDGTSETDLYIYGTLDKNGNAGQNNSIAAWGIEVGDEITVEGPKTLYGSTVELVNVTVVKINKSLIKVDSLTVDGVKTEDPMPVEGGLITANLTCKGNGVSVDIPEDAKNWLSIVSIDGSSPSVTFRVAPNDGGDRSTTLTFTTTDGKKQYTSEVVIAQKGAIIAATVQEFLDAEVGTTQYRLNGIITRLYYYKENVAGFYIADYSGETLVYKASGFTGTEAKPGDVVTVVGQRGDYKGAAQLVSGMLENVDYAVTEVTIAEFLTKEDNKNVYYKVTGTIKSLLDNKGEANDYGNMTITDNGTDLYVYGCYPGWGAKKVGDVDYRMGLVKNLGIIEGDKITIIGVKASYKGSPQLSNGVYFSHEKAE